MIRKLFLKITLTIFCVTSWPSIVNSADNKHAKKSESRSVTEEASPPARKAEVFTQLGHRDRIERVAFAQAENVVLSIGSEGLLKYWDTVSGREIRTFDRKIFGFSPDGQYVLLKENDMLVMMSADDNKIYKTFKDNKPNQAVFGYAFSKDNKFLVLGRAIQNLFEFPTDHTIDIWDTTNGKLLRSIKARDGLSSIALSVEQNIIIAGNDNGSVSVYDFNYGSEKRVIKAYSVDPIFTMAISPDGQYAIWLCNNGKNIRLWNINNNNITTKKSSEQIVKFMFSPNGKEIITGNLDGSVNIIQLSNWEIINKIKSHKVMLNALSVSKDGKFILTGGSEGEQVETMKLWEYVTGKEIQIFKGLSKFRDDRLFYEKDGNKLLLENKRDGLNTKSDNRIFQFLSGSINTSLVVDKVISKLASASKDLIPLPPNRQYFLNSYKCDNEFKCIYDIIDIQKNTKKTINKRINIAEVDISRDGKHLITSTPWTPEEKSSEIEYFDLAKGTSKKITNNGGYVTSLALSPDNRYLAVGQYYGEIEIWDIQKNKKIKNIKNDIKENLKNVNATRKNVNTLVYLSNGEFILEGNGNHNLYLWDVKKGKYIKTFTGHQLDVISLATSPNERYFASGSMDGTTIIWDFSGNIISTIVNLENGEWVVVTPEGYYNSSPNGHKYLNVRIGNRVYGIDQFYDVFYRPDIVQAKLRGENISPLINITIDDAIKSPPPTVKFTQNPSDTASAKTQVCYQATNTGGGIGEVRIFQNGKLVKSDGFYRENIAKVATEKRQLVAMNSRAIQDEMRGLVVKEKEKPVFIVSKPKGETFEECVDLETVPGENEISVTAFNSGNTIQSYMQTTSFNSTRTPDEPHLYILAVGIDKYSDNSVNLKYAAKDASDFISKLPEKSRGLYKPANIHLETILDAQASRAGILNKIDELSGKIKPGDSFILFVASHGVLVQDQYYIVTADYDGNLYDTKKLISSNEIVDMSKKIKSLSQLFIFDTCHAGGVDNIISGLYDARMSVMAKKMGLHIYASAGSVQTAMDGYKGNGLYTHTLLQGIANGKDVDKEKSGKVTVKNLGLYTKEKTTEISTKLGHPQTPYIINFGRDNPLFTVH